MRNVLIDLGENGNLYDADFSMWMCHISPFIHVSFYIPH